MKRVVQNKKEETIDLDSIDWTNPHIGVVIYGSKHFLHKLNGHTHCIPSKYRLGGTHYTTAPTHEKCAQKLLSEPHEVYVFDSHKELFLWLAE